MAISASLKVLVLVGLSPFLQVPQDHAMMIATLCWQSVIVLLCAPPDVQLSQKAGILAFCKPAPVMQNVDCPLYDKECCREIGGRAT